MLVMDAESDEILSQATDLYEIDNPSILKSTKTEIQSNVYVYILLFDFTICNSQLHS